MKKLLSVLCQGLGFLCTLGAIFLIGFDAGTKRVGLVEYAVIVICSLLAIYVYMVIHELGHAFFGYLTNYQILLMSIGRLTWIKQDNQWIFKYTKLTPSVASYVGVKKDWSDKRTMLMLLGGIIFHACLSLLFVIIWWGSDGLSGNNYLYLSHALINLGLLFINISPSGTTDGARVFELIKYPERKILFYEQLDCFEKLLKQENIVDLSIKDISLENDGSIIENYYIFKAQQYRYMGELNTAKQMYESYIHVSNHSVLKGMTQILLLEVMIILGDIDKARELYHSKDIQLYLKQKKTFEQFIQSMYYAYIEQDFKQAKKYYQFARKYENNALMYHDEKELYQIQMENLYQVIHLGGYQ